MAKFNSYPQTTPRATDKIMVSRSDGERLVNVEEVGKWAEIEELKNEVSILFSSGIKEFDEATLLNMVDMGIAEKYMKAGDQIYQNWYDADAEKNYEVPHNVLGFKDVELENGTIKRGMGLKWHYCTPFGIQFSADQAFYYCETELPAGAYHVEMGQSWGDNVVAGKFYSFTLTNPVPAGGQLAGFNGAPDTVPSSWKVNSYNSNATATALESVNVVEGANGTKLGRFTRTGIGEALNSLDMTAYGNSLYELSAVRQYLNSEAERSAWWNPQSIYDRPPSELSSKRGFLYGYGKDFKNIIAPTKIATHSNAFTETDKTYVTYDKFFLLSLEEMYINPQKTGEGSYWDYWKAVRGQEAKFQQWQTYPELKHYRIDNKTASQGVRLRSALRGGGYVTWVVSSSGGVGYGGGYARGSWRVSPACIVAKSTI